MSHCAISGLHHEAVAGRCAVRVVRVCPVEDERLVRQPIDVRRDHEVGVAVGFQLRPQILAAHVMACQLSQLVQAPPPPRVEPPAATEAGAHRRR